MILTETQKTNRKGRKTGAWPQAKGMRVLAALLTTSMSRYTEMLDKFSLFGGSWMGDRKDHQNQERKDQLAYCNINLSPFSNISIPPLPHPHLNLSFRFPVKNKRLCLSVMVTVVNLFSGILVSSK